MKKKGCLLGGLILVFLLLIIATAVYAFVIVFPEKVISVFGEPDLTLSSVQQILTADRLYFKLNSLMSPVDPNAGAIKFIIQTGESVDSITQNLVNGNFIRDVAAFRNLLIFSGIDRKIQAGTFTLSPSMNSLQIAQALQDATPEDITFNILPGWRAEEIAASLPTSGLQFSGEEFLNLVRTPSSVSLPDGFPNVTSLEGYLLPGAYTFKRVITAPEMISTLIQSFWEQISPEMKNGYVKQNLTVEQAVILASMVQREAIVQDEMPQIASVFYNRLVLPMKLDSDPTVQYAIGFDQVSGSWWKNPLYGQDLSINSSFNTYLVSGLPPAPICEPSLAAMQAVAFPAQTPYYYFRARCDGSGLHSFAITLEEQKNNACP